MGLYSFLVADRLESGFDGDIWVPVASFAFIFPQCKNRFLAD